MAHTNDDNTTQQIEELVKRLVKGGVSVKTIADSTGISIDEVRRMAGVKVQEGRVMSDKYVVSERARFFAAQGMSVGDAMRAINKEIVELGIDRNPVSYQQVRGALLAKTVVAANNRQQRDDDFDAKVAMLGTLMDTKEWKAMSIRAKSKLLFSTIDMRVGQIAKLLDVRPQQVSNAVSEMRAIKELNGGKVVCAICGRPLFDAEHKKKGVGPVCAMNRLMKSMNLPGRRG